MIIEKKLYRIICDKCHCGYTNENLTRYFTNKGKLIDRIIDDGWIIQGDKHICWKCLNEEKKNE